LHLDPPARRAITSTATGSSCVVVRVPPRLASISGRQRERRLNDG
jgi:hypothetical protein